jgi:gas vesicle protein
MKQTHICAFLIGLSIGAATAVLFAPHSGKKTRAQISEAATNGAAYVKDRGETLKGAVLGFIERRKDEIALHKEGVAEAIRQGTHAYHQAVS